MFRWCCFCQTFMGESNPRDDFSLTHGICPTCRPKTPKDSLPSVESIAPIKAFFQELQTSVFEQKIDKSRIIQEAKRLGIHPADLLMGIIQPLLYEIGKLYSVGKVTITQEHRFSSLVKELAYSLKAEFLDVQVNTSQNVDVFLTCAEGNYHEFGILFLELRLKKSGLVVESLSPGLPPADIIDQAKRLSAKVIGLSISMESQLETAKEIARILNLPGESYKPLLIVGGFAVKTETQNIEGATLFKGSITELIEFIQKHIHHSG